jgi:hypothetical protein
MKHPAPASQNIGNKLSKAIRIAIAGKRSHAGLSLLETDGRVTMVLDSLSDCCRKRNANTLFLSGLADGADQLVTGMVSRYQGFAQKPVIQAILPFSVSSYRNHPVYPIVNTSVFDSLLASCSSTLCVNDEESSALLCDKENPDVEKAATRAYIAQALVMLRRCDVLLAIGDPSDAPKAGGTNHTVLEARAKGIPVIYLSLADDQVYLLNNENIVNSLVFINTQGKGIGVSQQALDELFNDILNGQSVGKTADEMLDKQLVAGKNRSWLTGARSWAWRYLNTYLKRNITHPDSNREGNYQGPAHAGVNALQNNADDVNGFLSAQYRGGFILNNLLAVVAVFLAASALLVVYFEAGHTLLLVLTVIKLIVLLAIYNNSKAGKKLDWNENSIATRYLAERLRIYEYLLLNGITKGIRPSLGRHVRHLFRSSPSECLYKRIEADQSLVQGTVVSYLNPVATLIRFNNELVKGQIAYHRQSAKKMHKLEHILEALAERLNMVIIVLVLVDIVIALMGLPTGHGIKKVAESAEWFHDWIVPFVIAATVVFPVLVAGLNAVRFQSEARKLKERYSTMQELLAKIAIAIDQVKPHPLGSDVLECYPLIAEVEHVMLDEVSDWSLLYRKEFVEP